MHKISRINSGDPQLVHKIKLLLTHGLVYILMEFKGHRILRVFEFKSCS